MPRLVSISKTPPKLTPHSSWSFVMDNFSLLICARHLKVFAGYLFFKLGQTKSLLHAHIITPNREGWKMRHFGLRRKNSMSDILIKPRVFVWTLGFALCALSYATIAIAPVQAHPGGLAADGCHNDRQNGGRHCHRGSTAGNTAPPRSTGGGEVYYANCAAARAAGAAPVRRGSAWLWASPRSR